MCVAGAGDEEEDVDDDRQDEAGDAGRRQAVWVVDLEHVFRRDG